MQIRPEQLTGHLKRGLAPIYVVSGDEPLQTGEALEAIRQSARALGFTERVVLHADTHFDWNLINQYADSPSLFGEKRLLDIRMPSGAGPGQQGSGALIRYAARPVSDQVMLLATSQLDARQRKSKWYQSLDRAGVGVLIWPVDARNLPHWITARTRRMGMSITGEAAGLLAERVEGNLLACAQEIDKLALLHDGREISAQDVLACVLDSARFDAFGLVDSTLAGDAQRTARILSGLREEGTEPLPILGMLVWESREMARIAGEIAAGAPPDRVIGQQPAWRRRKQAVAQALGRRERSGWIRMLRTAESVDRIIKGVQDGDPWDALSGFALSIAGVRLPSPLT
uniref:DNA polymerase III subunit delta n=1 Tax=Candidatus Kentrum sp. FM TaxID=2126340 RepID=A0A450VWW0_9GAMM|nr:MAG: DNA polymerase-3 subunit delta [Candidatus Kentron sp. FM]VFJ65458.1 MAG: DNA polymerase-3 subunit delta [Candidatus Kentron sp. FM]VFK09303.1 MAG: DNA polymerase-3 subunit delta [Candidatus Kentron sp. FM]